MADQDPYEPGAVWVRTDTELRARILGVIEDDKGIVPMHKPGTVWVAIAWCGAPPAGSGLPELWTLAGFLNWFKRPDGGQPRPSIPRQRDREASL
jgi:hypothetical protein